MYYSGSHRPGATVAHATHQVEQRYPGNKRGELFHADACQVLALLLARWHEPGVGER